VDYLPAESNTACSAATELAGTCLDADEVHRRVQLLFVYGDNFKSNAQRSGKLKP
jgi:hypothetical protein